MVHDYNVPKEVLTQLISINQTEECLEILQLLALILRPIECAWSKPETLFVGLASR